ncbi:hypothetical protein C2U63_12455 [Burkholderia pseudomallei]|uniref:Uncharacterized protein n=2 Tax=Burkholderia pseudomallei TaxID=28450 RepID=A0AAX0UE89_BURPE|nr:conserved hypothetical protein [Burkholderia pseudomallei 1106a]AFR15406.1 hypothetical protein BPC006_I1527 [Burkholderia pseudomallei BPC006]ARK98505.1 hypothetical protein BOC43_30475 [Burkholderia pseudomallei]EES25605.1 conserved hypothetical protein [Burkholderia pseudomallei 1106b]AUL55779.1 hypothetical protein BHT10_07690 [Burkholderia pseudomallei]
MDRGRRRRTPPSRRSCRSCRSRPSRDRSRACRLARHAPPRCRTRCHGRFHGRFHGTTPRAPSCADSPAHRRLRREKQ